MSDVSFFGTLAPNAGSTAPLTRGEYITGVPVIVADATARDLIPAARLRAKQLCLLASTGVWYQWSGASWGTYNGFGSGFPLTDDVSAANFAISHVKTLSFDGEIDNTTNTIDFTTGALQKKTLAANTTLATPTPPPPFTSVQFRAAQPSSGGTYNYTLTFWAGIIWDGGAAPSMPTGAGAELIVGGYHDGTTWRLGGPASPALTLAQGRLAGRGGASGTGVAESITPANGLEFSGTTLQLSSQLPARGGENVVVDLYPSTQQQGTINTGASVNFDVPISAGKRYKIVADVWCDDGAGGVCQFAKALAIVAHQTGGAAVLVTNDSTHDNQGAGWSFTATNATTNVRFTLSNASGTNRTYNIAIGFFSMDKP